MNNGIVETVHAVAHAAKNIQLEPVHSVAAVVDSLTAPKPKRKRKAKKRPDLATGQPKPI